MWNDIKISFLRGFRNGWALFLSPFLGFWTQLKENWRRSVDRR